MLAMQQVVDGTPALCGVIDCWRGIDMAQLDSAMQAIVSEWILVLVPVMYVRTPSLRGQAK